MTELDSVLKQIADEPAKADLTRLEAEVWARIDQDRNEPVMRSAGFDGPVAALRSPVSAIFFALLIGAVIGGTSLQSHSSIGPMSAFSSSVPYAPSTLLGGAVR